MCPANRFAGAKLLVVDDDPEILEIVGELLRDRGFIVKGAHGGAEALAMLQAGDFRLVVTDVRMPNMNGVELARRAREVWPGLPVVLMSGYVPPEIDDGHHFLRKPFRSHELFKAVADALNQAIVTGFDGSEPEPVRP